MLWSEGHSVRNSPALAVWPVIAPIVVLEALLSTLAKENYLKPAQVHFVPAFCISDLYISQIIPSDNFPTWHL